MTDYTDNMNHRVSESPPLSSKSEWTSVLHLSHTWNFPSMRSLAVRQLLSLTTPVDRVVLGRKYDVEHWLRPAYQAICEREEWLSEQEGERLGLRDVLKIGRARQLLRAPVVLREEEERRSLLDGVFGDHPSSTTDDIPPSPLALASEDDPVQQSFATSSSAYTEHMDLSREIESLPALEVTAATTDTSVDTSSHKPADDLYKAALGPVYAPVTSSLRDQLLRAVSEINSAEEAMSKDQQTAAEEEANAKARYNVYRSDNNSRALDKARDKLSRAQQVTTSLEGAYNSFVVIVSPYCPSLAKSYHITPEARKELASLISVLTAAEQSANIALQATQHIEYCKAHEAFCARTYATSRTEEDEGSLRRARSEVHAAVAHAQKQEQQEQDAKDMLARAHLALAAFLSKLLVSAVADQETVTEAV
jgi:molecular chaperone GrpE (heat shock protein)